MSVASADLSGREQGVDSVGVVLGEISWCFLSQEHVWSFLITKSPDLCPSEASRLPAPGWDRGGSLKVSGVAVGFVPKSPA